MIWQQTQQTNVLLTKLHNMIHIDYMVALCLVWLFGGWIHMVKAESDLEYDYIPLHHTLFYMIMSVVPLLMVAISLLINWTRVGFLSTCCYIGLLIITQLLNINLLYGFYRTFFRRDGIGTLLPLLGSAIAIICMFILQPQ